MVKQKDVFQKKMNICLGISRNFDTVKLDLLDETIEYETESELKAKIRKVFSLLQDEIDLEFKKIQGDK